MKTTRLIGIIILTLIGLAVWATPLAACLRGGPLPPQPKSTPSILIFSILLLLQCFVWGILIHYLRLRRAGNKSSRQWLLYFLIAIPLWGGLSIAKFDLLGIKTAAFMGREICGRQAAVIIHSETASQQLNETEIDLILLELLFRSWINKPDHCLGNLERCRWVDSFRQTEQQILAFWGEPTNVSLLPIFLWGTILFAGIEPFIQLHRFWQRRQTK